MTQSILQYMHPDDLVPYYNNPRHNQDAIGPVAESIKAFGYNVPIVVDENEGEVDRRESHQATRVA